MDHFGEPFRWPKRMTPVLFLAASLRLWSIDFGRGVERARPDEEYVVGHAVQMLQTGDPNPHFFHYPSFLMYVEAAALWALGPTPDSHVPRLFGRLLSVACGVGTVAVVGFLGVRLISAQGGVLAAGLVSVAYLHVRESHFATTDVPFTFLVAASIAIAVEGFFRRRVGLLRAAAVLAGLATSTKYPGALVLAPLAFVGASLAFGRGLPMIRELAVELGLFLAAFAVTSPYILLDTEGVSTSLAELFRESWGRDSPTGLDPLFPLTFALAHGLGLPLLSLGLAGLPAGSRRFGGRLLLAWVLPFYMAAALTPIHFARYSLPLVPPLCLAAATLIERLPIKGFLKLALFVTATVPTLATSVAFVRVLGREDTRSLATKWIAETLPAGTPVQVSSGYGEPSLPPGYPVRRVGFRLGAVRQAEREGFHYLVTHEHPVLTRFSRVDRSLEERLRTAILLERFEPCPVDRPPGVYDELDAFYVPFADPGSIERPGPVVSIWKLVP